MESETDFFRERLAKYPPIDHHREDTAIAWVKSFVQQYMITKPRESMFTEGWAKNWHIVDGDEQLAKELLPVFEKYLASLQEKGVSKSTMNRHKNACHAIGGYIINQVFKYERDKPEDPWDGEEIIFQHVYGFDGPLIYQNNHTLQKEVDATSRKLYSFILKGTV